MIEIAIAEIVPDSAVAQGCLAAYYAELDRRFAHGFDLARSCDPDAADLVRPRGAFLVATAPSSSATAIGCVALKGSGGTVAEIKRLWTQPSLRGRGIGRRLITAAATVAGELGVTVLRLNTAAVMPEAIALYLADGWSEIPRFNDDPYPDRFFEKRIGTLAAMTSAGGTA